MKCSVRRLVSLAACAALGAALCGCGSRGFDPSASIGVITREDGSGTRSAFAELFEIEEKQPDGTILDHTVPTAAVTNSTSVVLTTVAEDPAAIGYVSMGSLNDTVKALSVDGAKPTAENVADGSYKIYRPFNIVIHRDGLSQEAQDFLSFIMSDQGQSVAEENSYIPITNVSAYTPAVSSGKVIISGSSSVTPLMEKLKEAYGGVNSGVEVEIQQSDSSTGIADAAAGTSDIGMASRDLKDSEKEKDLTSEVIAYDGIAIIVCPLNTTENLTSEQVRKIYTGDMTTWSQISD